MRDLVVLLIHFIATLARLLGPGGARSLVAESLLLKHQLLILNRSRQRAPNLSASDRILAGWLALWLRPTRLLRSAIVLKPSTLLGLHQAMCKGKYRMLFSPNHNRKPGPKGPSAELVHAVVEMKQRNPRWGCPRIAEQITLAFNLPIDKDMVRRILAHHYWPGAGSGGPSWLTFLGHTKDSLWSMDLFRCESVTLRTHWALVVMDQYTRRIVGFGVHAGTPDGVALCRMFNRAIRGQCWLPKYLSSDHDPLYKFHQWQANLRILLFGTFHLFHTSPGSAVAAYEKDYPNLTFVISDLTDFDMKLPVSWQSPSLIPAKGTWLGALDLGHFYPAPISMDSECRVHNEFSKDLQKPMADLVDAFLYLNPERLALKEQLPADIVLDSEYWAELKRRETLQGFPGSNDQQIVNEAESPLIYSPTPEETKALMQGALVQQDVQDCLAKKGHGGTQR